MIVTERMLANQARRRFPQLDRREKVRFVEVLAEMVGHVTLGCFSN